ncbi:glycogen/starch/alpha-glucan phosphorylase [Candidatus Saccharibacteria bacterium]|nr:glycogen/starch/alpha-glucan phosphorylase [Candidatus Saccharibacteria bacterium]
MGEKLHYIYCTLEYYDQENGIRGGGGLGVLAADTRRVAEEMHLPLVTVTPFYPTTMKQVMKNGKLLDEKTHVNYEDYGYHKLDYVFVKCNGGLCKLDVIQKICGTTAILAVTEPNFGALYQDTSGSDHRLYQEVALGFGGYQALKIAGAGIGVMQLNEVVTTFMALKWLDDLVRGGMDFYQAMTVVRSRTLYTNHTLVQAAEAEFTLGQFEKYVLSNLESRRVKEWVVKMFDDGRLKLSALVLELAGKRNCVSKLHAKVADYHDVAGEKVKFRAVTNGIDLKKWVMPEILAYYQKIGLVEENLTVTKENLAVIDLVKSEDIRALKAHGREVMNEILKDYPDQNGKILRFDEGDFVFDFKRRLVDYKRPEMPFSDIKRLREVLEPRGAHYIIAGRVHTGDVKMMEKLEGILEAVRGDEYLSEHVHYLADYGERLAYGLSVGSNAALNLPIVGLEACGTSWMKDVANMNVLISTLDGGVADAESKFCFPVTGDTFEYQLDRLYNWMRMAIQTWDNDFDLEFNIAHQLYGYLRIISGARMMQEYLDLWWAA